MTIPDVSKTTADDEHSPFLDEAYVAWLKYADRYWIEHGGAATVANQHRLHAYMEGYLDAKEGVP